MRHFAHHHSGARGWHQAVYCRVLLAGVIHQPFHGCGTSKLAGVLSSKLGERGYIFVSVPGARIFCPVPAVVCQAPFVSEYSFLGWAEFLVSWRSDFVFARIIIKWPHKFADCMKTPGW